MSAPPSILFASATDRGHRRAQNQDAYGVAEADDACLFIVADGMGGHRGGQEASRLAVEAIEAALAAPGPSPGERLRTAFAEANARIYGTAQDDSALAGMGTTATALLLTRGRAWLAHVGDSRAYGVSADGIRQLTDDHSHVAEMMRQGLLTAHQARTHPHRNMLTRALGVWPHVDVDVVDAGVARGRTFVLCTDGLAEVDDAEIARAVAERTPDDACAHLVALALERGGDDNVTVQVIRVE